MGRQKDDGSEAVWIEQKMGASKDGKFALSMVVAVADWLQVRCIACRRNECWL